MTPRPVIGLVALILWCGGIASVVTAQPPGTMPAEALLPAVPGSGVPANKSPTGDAGANPKSPVASGETTQSPVKVPGSNGSATEDDTGRDERELNLKAFLLLDEAGNPVIMPGMTFEKLDQLQRMQEGWQQLSQLYTIESLEVRGRVVETTAELNITARIELEPTAGTWVSVSL